MEYYIHVVKIIEITHIKGLQEQTIINISLNKLVDKIVSIKTYAVDFSEVILELDYFK